MAPKTAPTTPPAKEIQLTARDMEVLAKSWQCFDGQPKINWQKLADVAHFKNAETARVCFGTIKKKLHKVAQVEPSTPTKSGGKRKATAEKTASCKKAKRSGKDMTSFEEDDDEDTVNAKIKADLKAGIEDEDTKSKIEDDVDGEA
ncbi:hypothetical protein GGS26DRAFT_51401 [Hypomontagnella submonticulosa]|nr:hypothetical protein GGS26DRAFT_51401 [Hypomontagnella submonticulosa]